MSSEAARELEKGDFLSPCSQARRLNKIIEARESVGDQVANGLNLALDWFRSQRVFSRPITEHGKAKPKKFRIKFDV